MNDLVAVQMCDGGGGSDLYKSLYHVRAQYAFYVSIIFLLLDCAKNRTNVVKTTIHIYLYNIMCV